ncbi:MAG: hypothetical protein ACK559_20060, partial [bacterium]
MELTPASTPRSAVSWAKAGAVAAGETGSACMAVSSVPGHRPDRGNPRGDLRDRMTGVRSVARSETITHQAHCVDALDLPSPRAPRSPA